MSSSFILKDGSNKFFTTIPSRTSPIMVAQFEISGRLLPINDEDLKNENSAISFVPILS
jgi:hypothetical protein